MKRVVFALLGLALIGLSTTGCCHHNQRGDCCPPGGVGPYGGVGVAPVGTTTVAAPVAQSGCNCETL